MQAERPEKLIDPVCGMTVDVARAEASGLLLEHEGRTFAFCRAGCKRAFVEEAGEYLAKAEAAEKAAADGAGASKGLPVIDEGRNISYAVQWILFALVALAGWFFFLRREARTVAAEGKDPTWTSA